MNEPTYSELSSIKTMLDELHKIDKNHMGWVNLSLSTSIANIGNSQSYQDYLDHVQELISPAVWSYDYYPIITKNGETLSNAVAFYKYLHIFTEMALQTRRPFWAHCMSMPYTTKTYSRPTPTAGMFRYEAFGALAFGAQGIIYWAYTQRDPTKNEHYESAPIDIDGNKTSIWYAAQEINAEIKQYTDVFLNSKFVKSWIFTNGPLPMQELKPTMFPPLKSIEFAGEGVVCTHLQTKENNYLCILSRDPFNSQRIAVSFYDDYSVRPVGPPIQGISPTSYSIQLPPGGYMIYKWS